MAHLCSQLLTICPVSGAVFSFYISRDLIVNEVYKYSLLSCFSVVGGTGQDWLVHGHVHLTAFNYLPSNVEEI